MLGKSEIFGGLVKRKWISKSSCIQCGGFLLESHLLSFSEVLLFYLFLSPFRPSHPVKKKWQGRCWVLGWQWALYVYCFQNYRRNSLLNAQKLPSGQPAGDV